MKRNSVPTRRNFLQSSTVTAVSAALAPYWFTAATQAQKPAASDRIRVGAIGVGDRSRSLLNEARGHCDIVAVADVDARHVRRAIEQFEGKPEGYSDYRKLLERKDIDAVIIATPDHWHTKPAIESMQSGRDVYCEKPLTLTIEEGKQICQVAKATNRVFQVGTQQRSDAKNFLLARAIVQAGRIGDVKRVWAAIGGGDRGGPFKKQMCPAELNYEMWLGQAPLNDYIPERVYYTFRWWYDYSGGKLTDWGAHHVDIAQWILDMDNTSPVTVEPLEVTHPVAFKDGYPTGDNAFNTATNFKLNCQFASGLELRIQDSVKEPGLADFGNGVLFEGSKGRLFVNRERVSGTAVEELEQNPLPEDALRKAYKGHAPTHHMKNYFDCIRTREQPISDVFSHHRILTTCHLSNIALRLNKTVNWDPETEQVVGDAQAASLVSRKQREAYCITV